MGMSPAGHAASRNRKTGPVSCGAIVLRDRARAIAHAIGGAGAHDIVLVAGKGHEPYQEIAGVKHAFDDTLVAQEQLDAGVRA